MRSKDDKHVRESEFAEATLYPIRPSATCKSRPGTPSQVSPFGSPVPFRLRQREGILSLTSVSLSGELQPVSFFSTLSKSLLDSCKTWQASIGRRSGRSGSSSSDMHHPDLVLGNMPPEKNVDTYFWREQRRDTTWGVWKVCEARHAIPTSGVLAKRAKQGGSE